MQFFGCYFNLFRLMAKCGVLQNLLKKEHVHTFVNTGGDVRELDFRFFVGDKKIGAPFHGLKAFFTTPQLSVLDKVRQSLSHHCEAFHTYPDLWLPCRPTAKQRLPWITQRARTVGLSVLGTARQLAP